MNLAVPTTLRRLIMYTLFFLPRPEHVRVERWLRGHEDFRKLALADCVIVSFGKSGRTWLRVMMSRFYQIRYGLSQRHLLAFDNLHNRVPAIPRVFFTHDNYMKDYIKDSEPKSAYRNKRVILMVRHPADVAVSQYYQWKFRMPTRKKTINNYPAPDEDLSLFDFVMRPDSGLLKIVEFMNGWGREIERMRDLMIVRYEDLRAEPETTLGRILDFAGTPGSAEDIREAVRFASVENMRQMERKRVFWLSGRRMLAKDRSNLNTYKVRRAKVGGYRDDFTPEQVAAIDRLVADHLMPVFGYHREAPAPQLVAG